MRGIQLSVHDPKTSSPVSKREEIPTHDSMVDRGKLKRPCDTFPLRPSEKRCKSDRSIVDHLIVQRVAAAESQGSRDTGAEDLHPCHDVRSSHQVLPAKDEQTDPADGIRHPFQKDLSLSDRPRALFVVRSGRTSGHRIYL